MYNNIDNYRESLIKYWNKRVVGIMNLKFFYNNIVDKEDDGILQFILSDDTSFTLKTSDNIDSIVINNNIEVPESFCVDDYNLCSWRLINLLEEDEYKCLFNQKIVNFELISILNNSNIIEKFIIGIKISFGIGDYLLFLDMFDVNKFQLNDDTLFKKIIKRNEVEILSLV